jgi:hypothetical protein
LAARLVQERLSRAKISGQEDGGGKIIQKKNAGCMCISRRHKLN